METTALYNDMKNAEAAEIANDYAIPFQNAALKAIHAYYAAVDDKRVLWNALPEDDRKASAEENANDSEGTAIDLLRWYEVALMTYELNA